MQYFKRLIQKIFEVYETHDMNKRFFPEKITQASQMCSVILYYEQDKPLDYKHMNRVNQVYKLYYTAPIKKTLANIKRKNYKTFKEFKKARQTYLEQQKMPYQTLLRQLLQKDLATINQFLIEYKHVVIEEEAPKIQASTPGVIGVLHPALTYEKQSRRRR